MGAIADIQSWIDINRRVYKPYVQEFTKASFFQDLKKNASVNTNISKVINMMAYWVDIAIREKRNKGAWEIEALTDADFAKMSNVAMSKELFAKVASQMKSKTHLKDMDEFVKKSLRLMKEAEIFKGQANRFGYNSIVTDQHVEICYLTGTLLFLMAFFAYYN